MFLCQKHGEKGLNKVSHVERGQEDVFVCEFKQAEAMFHVLITAVDWSK
jgi:hypothetical protein